MNQRRFLPAAARAWSLNGHSARPEALRDLEHMVWLHMRDRDPQHTRSHLPMELAASLAVENGESELGMFFGVAVWRLLSAEEIANALQRFTFWGWPYSRSVSASLDIPTRVTQVQVDYANTSDSASGGNDENRMNDVARGSVVDGDFDVDVDGIVRDRASIQRRSREQQLGVLIPAVSLSQQIGFEFVCVDSLSGRVYQYNSSTSLAVFISKSWTHYLQVQ
jgi:hypothetical protein